MANDIEFKAIEFKSVHEAIQHCEASGRGRAILWSGRNLVVEPAEADRLAAAGVEFAYVGIHEMPDGSERVVTIPVN